MKYVRGILMGINIVCLIALLGCYAAYYLNASQFWYISLLGLGYFVFVVLNLVMIVVWLFVKWKYAFISLAAILIGFGYHSKMIAIKGPHKIPADTKLIKVVSYNIQLFKYYDWKKNEVLRDRILTYIGGAEADIFCFQEYLQMRNNEFETTERLQNILPEHHMHFVPGVVKYNNQEYGLATFSKYPVVGGGSIKIDSTKNRTNLVIYTDVLIHEDTVRIYNVHLASNHLNTNEVDSMLSTNEKSFSFIKKWVKKLKNGYKRRYAQVNLLHEHLIKCTHPCIIAGDFNDVPVSYTYRKMSSKFKDAFIESGAGIGATYNGNLPMLRIDYIFYSNDLGAAGFKVERLGITDHFPIMAELYMKNRKGAE